MSPGDSSTYGDELTPSGGINNSDDVQDKKPKRNYNLNEISNAVKVEDDDTFQKTTFGLKRTQSMGLLDATRPNMSVDLIGTKSDYPHLDRSDNIATGFNNATAIVPSSQHEEDVVVNHNDYATSYNAGRYSTSTTTTEPIEHHEGEYEEEEEDYYYYSDEDESLPMPGSPELMPLTDDSAVQHEPSRHVDYLSHDWKESDISASWRYIVMRRKDVANSARLENASWRTWTKAKYNLPTVSPESVNWLKDYDVTWLYGPLYEEPAQSYALSGGEITPLSPTLYEPDEHKQNQQVGTPTGSQPAPTKPILKKRSASQKILETSGKVGDEVDFYFRQHNYRHKVPVNPNVFSRVNQQYVNNDDDTAATSDVNNNTTNTSNANTDTSTTTNTNATTTTTTKEHDDNSNDKNNDTPMIIDVDHQVTNEPETIAVSGPSTPAAVAVEEKPLERRIHFNDRVEQCRALAYYSDDELANNNNTGYSSSEEEEDDDDDDDDDDEEEAGLFLMVRSASQPTVPTLNQLKPLNGVTTIEQLPATTLKYDYEEGEREARETVEANSVAYAMSHNTANRRHVYKTYDYSSVYESPEPSPNHSPRSGSYESFNRVVRLPLESSTATSSEPVPAQTSSETAQGQFSSSSDYSSEFVEDTAAEQQPATPPLQQSPEQQDSPGSDSSDERKLSRVNSALNAAKGIASSLWHGNWKKDEK